MEILKSASASKFDFGYIASACAAVAALEKKILAVTRSGNKVRLRHRLSHITFFSPQLRSTADTCMQIAKPAPIIAWS